jgi:ATP-binding cassette subfamily B protein
VLSANYWHMRNITFTNMADTLTNILNVKIFNARDYEVQALKNNFAKDNLAEQAMLRLMLKLSVVQVSLVALLMIGLLGMLLVNFKNNVGDLVFVLLLASNIVKNVDELSVVLAKYTHVYAKCADAMKTIFVAHDIVDGDDAIVLNIPNGKIEFKNVSFQYDNVPHLFKNKSINIHAGAKVGLVGFSGAGKTSLLNLLVRLYDAQNGEIYIDNQNLKSVTIDSLRKNISLVPQNITLFNRSIYDNILYGKTSATPIEVYAAAKKALCDQFVLNLPDSYQTICQEHGIVLSASECQRIAIARAFLRDTKIILLDEPAVCMDLESEHVLQAALRDLYVNRTVIVVSNKMATLKELDRIIVFNNGKIVQDGTHEQLIKINGTYKDLYLS